MASSRKAGYHNLQTVILCKRIAIFKYSDLTKNITFKDKEIKRVSYPCSPWRSSSITSKSALPFYFLSQYRNSTMIYKRKFFKDTNGNQVSDLHWLRHPTPIRIFRKSSFRDMKYKIVKQLVFQSQNHLAYFLHIPPFHFPFNLTTKQMEFCISRKKDRII